MATDPTQFRMMRGTTFELVDASGTPKSHTLNFAEGTFSFSNGGWTVVRAKDENGDLVGAPRQGEQAGASQISFSGRIFDVGNDAAAAKTADLIRQKKDSGYIGASWVSTNTDSDLLVLTARLTFPNIGSNKGAVYTWDNVTLEPGSSEEVKSDGVFVTATFSSSSAQPTITRNT